MSAAPAAAQPEHADDVRPAEEWPYRFDIIPLDELFVDERYQRPLSSYWKQVRDKFNPRQVGTFTVAPRGRKGYAVIDGQTRLNAMRAREELGLAIPPGAPCLVYDDLRRGEEAALFADLQTERKGMRSYDAFRARLVAGATAEGRKREPVQRALAVAKIATDLGFDLGVEETKDTLQSVGALLNIHKKGDDHLRDVLSIIAECFGTRNHQATSAEMLYGLSWFLLKQDQLDRDRLVDRLKVTEISTLKHRASGLREGKLPGSGTGRYVGQAIMNLYMARWQ